PLSPGVAGVRNLDLRPRVRELEVFDQLLTEIPHIHRRGLNRDGTGSHPRVVEEISDHSAHSLTGARHAVCEGPHPRLRGCATKEAPGRRHRGERVAKIVGQYSELSVLR